MAGGQESGPRDYNKELTCDWARRSTEPALISGVNTNSVPEEKRKSERAPDSYGSTSADGENGKEPPFTGGAEIQNSSLICQQSSPWPGREPLGPSCQGSMPPTLPLNEQWGPWQRLALKTQRPRAEVLPGANQAWQEAKIRKVRGSLGDHKPRTTTGNGWLKGVIIQLVDNRLALEFRSLAMKCGCSPIGSCRRKVFKLERFDKIVETVSFLAAESWFPPKEIMSHRSCGRICPLEFPCPGEIRELGELPRDSLSVEFHLQRPFPSMVLKFCSPHRGQAKDMWQGSSQCKAVDLEPPGASFSDKQKLGEELPWEVEDTAKEVSDGFVTRQQASRKSSLLPRLLSGCGEWVPL
ncbi:hypothetical protein MJG53_002585 [Ovis ammon polii x Ovis aries]|uniref:Uncharacterized protein n=1 Tax=Ovis ammon polii x Ovis aries TaxID=2918886 RepID=A0ACB9VEH5_9CETA|nr:hypothetical protein MJG53_002585 [Ovis ammon polii x Ovis aries]